jgi:Zn-finger protein
MSKDDSSTLRQCPRRGVPYLIGDDEKNEKRKIVKARCKQWDCEYCAPINRSEHYNRIANGLLQLSKQSYEFTFTTVTCHEQWRGKTASIKNWRKNKDKLLARFRRHHQKNYTYPPEYVYIPEIHQDGTIHIHGVFSGRVSTRWWKDNARACGLGYMAESAGLESILQAVNYCTKYIQKQMGVASITRNFRRINYSRGFPATKRTESVLEWRMLETDESIKSAIMQGLVVKNYAVEFDGKNWTFDDFLT